MLFTKTQFRLDLNSATIVNTQAFLNGRFNSRKIPLKGFHAPIGVIVNRCALARMSNDAVVPVFIVHDGQSNGYMLGGIFCDGTFQKNCPELFSHYGLNSEDYIIKELCESFNWGCAPIAKDLNIENSFSTDETRITPEELVEKLSSIMDLKTSYELHSPLNQDEYFIEVSTHNVIACKDSSDYVMPCTVELTNNIKTICYCLVRLDKGTAIPFRFIENELDADNQKLLKKITSIRPLIVSPADEDEVMVSEGLKLRLIIKNELELLTQLSNNSTNLPNER